MTSGIRRQLPAAISLTLALALGVPVVAQTADELIRTQHVMIRHRLEPSEPVFVGQPVRFRVDVMTRSWFLEAPSFPTALEVRNAIVIPPEAFAVNSSERIGGQNYAVQSRAYTVFPQTTGSFEVPPIAVGLVVALDDASRSPEISLETEQVTIEARLPAGAEGHGSVLSTPALAIDETYSRSTEGLKVGVSFERRAEMTIQESVAMLLPPVTFEAGEGVAIYPARPIVSDERNRGQFTGSRVDAATYVMEREGSYRLPPVSIWWWNLRTSRLIEATLPEVAFTVEANPDLAAEHLSEPETVEGLVAAEGEAERAGWGWKEWAITFVVLAVAALIVRRVSRRSVRGRGSRKEPGPCEAELFRSFEHAAQTGDPATAYQALISWLDRFEAVGSPATARAFVALANDAELARQVSTLELTLFGGVLSGGRGGWDGRSLAAAAGRTRQALAHPRRRTFAASSTLPPINPSSPGDPLWD